MQPLFLVKLGQTARRATYPWHVTRRGSNALPAQWGNVSHFTLHNHRHHDRATHRKASGRPSGSAKMSNAGKRIYSQPDKTASPAEIKIPSR